LLAAGACGRTGLLEDIGGGADTNPDGAVGANGDGDAGGSDGSADGGSAGPDADPNAGVIVVASYQNNPVCLAVDATNLYWCDYGTGAGDGYVMATAIGGGTMPRAITNGGDDPWAIAVHNGLVYWSSYGNSGSDGSIKSAPISGGFATTLAALQTYPYSLAVTDTDLYWTQRFDLNGTVNQVNLSQPGVITALASNLPYPTELTSRDGVLYWTSYVQTGAVYTMPTAGGPYSTLQGAQDFPFAITTDAKNLYWATRSGLYQQPLAGGPAKQIAPAAQRIIDIASDGETVYWADYFQQTVTSVPVGGGAVSTIASNQNGVRSIAVDSHNVYWVNYLDGTVLQKAK
jgi:hypothetical protein